MNRTGLSSRCRRAAVGLLFGALSATRSRISALFYDPTTHAFGALDMLARDVACARRRELADHADRRAGVYCRRRQARSAAAAHADRAAAPRCFCSLTLALGPGILANVILKDHWARIAAGRRDRSSAARSASRLVGSARRLSGELLVHRRRAVRRVLDAGAGRADAAAMATARLWRGARLRRRDRRAAHGRPARISSPTSYLPACSCSC